MTKPQLVAFVMENTAEYKKTHLMDKHKVELEVIAATFQQAEILENGTMEEPAREAQSEAEISHVSAEAQNGTGEPQPEDEGLSEAAASDNASENSGEQPEEIIENQSLQTDEVGTIDKVILTAYEKNKKIAKIRRADKNEFKETVIEEVMEQVAADGLTNPQAIIELTISVITLYAQDLIAFVPMNENERKMLETIPLLDDFESADSQVDAKNFLQKVKELHNIEVSSSRALMVSLKRKRFISIEGGKTTVITLLERGVKHLSKVS